ncbi:MAG: HD-GYP domain-containing protein [Actinomycetota bacterium]|nr:HD-GYP domain-containing protein [Actinomycetota bacterium]
MAPIGTVAAGLRTRAPGLPKPDAKSLEVVLSTINEYDAFAGGHPDRVATYAGELARLLGLSYSTVDLVKRAAFVHDIGKIFIPESIVEKPGALTTEEMEVVKMHPALGARMLEQRPGMADLAPIVLHHHERWDGNGYPDGLAGSAIPVESRIIFVADAYDAMISKRPYGRVMSRREAGLELARCAGKEFDPHVVRVMRFAINSGALDEVRKRPVSPLKRPA